MTFKLIDLEEETIELVPKRKAPRPLRRASKPVKNEHRYLEIYRYHQYWRIAYRPYKVNGEWCNYLGDYERKTDAEEDAKGIRKFDKLCKEENG